MALLRSAREEEIDAPLRPVRRRVVRYLLRPMQAVPSARANDAIHVVRSVPVRQEVETGGGPRRTVRGEGEAADQRVVDRRVAQGNVDLDEDAAQVHAGHPLPLTGPAR
jgi:hypothetical protein